MTEEVKTIYYYKGKRLDGRKLIHSITDGNKTWTYPKAPDNLFSGAKIGWAYELGPAGAIPDLWPDAATGDKHRDIKVWEAEHRTSLQQKKMLTYSATPNMDQYVKALRNSASHMSKANRALFAAYIVGEIMK